MTEQELIQENEKLKGRLQKAISVFSEQKAEISRLNTELEISKSRIKTLENQSNSSEENDTKFFEQLEEINQLTEKNSKLIEENKELCDRSVELSANNKSLENQLNTITLSYETYKTTQTQEYALLNAKLETYEKSLNEQTQQNSQLMEKYDMFESETNKKITELTEINTNIEKRYNTLKVTADEQIENLNKNIKQYLAEIETLKREIEVLKNLQSEASKREEGAKQTVKHTVEEIKKLSDNLTNNFNIFM